MRAINEETGEVLELVNDEWVPVQQPQPVDGADPDVPVATPESFTGGAPVDEGVSLNPLEKDFLGMQWPGNGPLDMLSAINPSFAGATGVAQAVQGTAARMPAVAGAVSRAVDPIAGAFNTAGQMIKSGAMTVGENLPLVGPAIERQATRIKSAELLKLAQQGGRSVGAASNPIRSHSMLYDPATLAQKLNISEDAMTPAQRAKLTFTEGQVDDVGRDINQALWGESKARFAGNASRQVDESWRNVEDAFSRKVYEDAGIPYGQAADQAQISVTRQQVGKDIGDLLESSYPSNFIPVAEENSLARVINSATDTEAAPAMRILKNYKAIKEGEDGAVDVAELSLANFNKMKSELQKGMEATSNPNVRATFEQVLQQLDNAAIDTMPDDLKQAYSGLKYKYKLLSKLQEPGVISPEGMVNPTSFGKQMVRGESKNMRHLNDMATLAETVKTITPKSNAGTTGARTLADDLAPEAGAVVGKFLGL